ncbi:hypothetical protein DC366_19085 [Pelagivirga sediminicola]|uniref:Uncharacterized protein n=1 Tax=Pelagivirga sediminicola TaxID=2170575 RepID=A0A2T7G227_9RHOB|nr:hypothetical protein DC366_19085 [Pelagivirga sediminicola]
MFSRFNGALAVAIEAERDITDIDVWDPAVNSWLREAERNWDVVFDLRRALREAAVTQAGDAALLAMVRIADAVMGSENVIDFGTADNRLRAATFFRQRLGRGCVPHHVSHMLDQCHARLSTVIRMELYQPVCDLDDLHDGLQYAWPEAC